MICTIVGPPTNPITLRKLEFVPCEELFPEWASEEPIPLIQKSCRSILTSFCERTDTWAVIMDSHNPSDWTAQLQYPSVKHRLFDEKVPEYIYFPGDAPRKVEFILSQLQSDYAPDLNHFVGEVVRQKTADLILNEIRNKEFEIINIGGRPVLDEMKFRLGVPPAPLGFGNITIDVIVGDDT